MPETNVSDSTRYVVAHILHDAKANIEGYITDYDAEAIQQAEDEGLLILAEYSDGSREIVKARDVREPEPMLNGIELVKPSYVDERTEAVIAVFDALASEYLAPQVAMMSLEEAAPAAGFFAALERLKEVANGDVER